MLQILVFLGSGDIGKPEVPVTRLTLDAVQRAGEVIGASSDQVRRSPVSGKNEDTRRSFFDKEVVIPKTEGSCNYSPAGYPILPSSWLNACRRLATNRLGHRGDARSRSEKALLGASRDWGLRRRSEHKAALAALELEQVSGESC